MLLPQCQGPGDEVTLHRRAAGLTEPRPSPPPSRGLTAQWPHLPQHTTSLPIAQTASPLCLYKPQGNQENISFEGLLTLARLHARKLAQINTFTHAHACAHVQPHTHMHNCTDSWKLLSSLIPSAVFQPVPCCLFRPCHPSLHPFLHAVLKKLVSHVVLFKSGVLSECCIPSKMYPRVCSGHFSSHL